LGLLGWQPGQKSSELMSCKPNILWICTDQQRFDTIGALGNPHVITPNIDTLVRQGSALERAYCQSPICTPSRSSFLTGVYPSTARANRNGNDAFSGAYPLVTRILADNGYTCANIGKLHLSSPFRRAERRADDGYEVFEYSHAPRDDWAEGHAYADWVREQRHTLSELQRQPEGIPAELHQTTWATDRAIDFMGARTANPWLLTLNIYDPHPPFNPPEDYRSLFDPANMPGPHFKDSDLAAQARLGSIDFQSRPMSPEALDIHDPVRSSANHRNAHYLQAAYYAMIKLIDDNIGRLLEALEALGLTDNTVVIFTSDHGETLGDHGLIEKGCRFYEGLVRVPLIWRWPGHVRADTRSDALVELLDLAPTLLDFAGIDVPAYMQGCSLRPLLEGRTAAYQEKTYVRSEYYDALDLPDASRATMIRTDRYKLVVYHGHGIGELFDLDRDPWEHNNLWDDEVHATLRSELVRLSFDATVATFDHGSERVGPY
jgi:arylsulfatase A-like enzyme